MKAEKILAAATIVATAFICTGMAMAIFLPEYKIVRSLSALFDTFVQTGNVVLYVSAAVLSLGLAGGLIFGAFWAVQHGWMLNLNRRLLGAAVTKAEREAALVITVAPPGSQVYASEIGKLPVTHKPLYLAPGQVNGVTIESTPEERQAWAFFQLTQNISKKPELAMEELPQLSAPLPETVDLAHYLMGACSIRRMFLGVGRLPSGQVQPIAAPLETLVHIATGGSSGFGKSTFMQALGYQCLGAKEHTQVVMLDTQGVTFTPFTGHNRLLYPLASDLDNIAGILAELVEEMKRREGLFKGYQGVFTLAQYNSIDGHDLPVVPIFFDEFGMAADDKRIVKHVKNLVQGGRKFGLYLIAGAQTWGADEIAMSIRGNLSTSIQFYARSKAQSRILLEDSRAAELTRPGQAFARLPGKTDLIELQAPDPSSVMDVSPMLLDEPGPAMPSEASQPGDLERRVLELAAGGASKAQICEAVWGYKSSNKYPEIEEILSRWGQQGAVQRAKGAI